MRILPKPECFEAHVRGLSSEGFGVLTHPDGRVFFAEGCWPEDQGLFEVLEFKGRYGYAKLLELRSASPKRRPAPCPHQGYEEGRCGGCPWMIGTYDSQLEHKMHKVKYSLERAKVIDESTTLLPILASPTEFNYRNRAQFKTDGEQIGFVSHRSHKIAAIEKCLVLNEKMSRVFEGLKEKLPNKSWEPTKNFNWVYLDVDDHIDSIDEVVVNRRRPFRQGNSRQNERMKDWLRQKLSLIRKSSAKPLKGIELFCGSGNFTEVLIQDESIADLCAVEVSASALAELKQRLTSDKLRTERIDLSKAASFAYLGRQVRQSQLLFLDPPREGAAHLPLLTRQLRELKHVLYVSCDVATFARDAVALKKQGFILKELQTVDLFPQTPHVELLAFFDREVP